MERKVIRQKITVQNRLRNVVFYQNNHITTVVIQINNSFRSAFVLNSDVKESQWLYED